MKLSDIKNEDALEVLAEILEPVSEIFGDEDVRKAFEGKAKKAEIASKVIKGHKTAIIKIMAAIDGVKYEDYECNIITLPMKLLELFNDELLLQFFQSQGLMMGDMFSGSATENTTETENQ